MRNLASLFLFIASCGGWINHIYVCFTEKTWGFLLLGALFFPLGIIHGIGVWLLGLWDILSRN